MKFSLEIKMDNAAFSETAMERESELRWILNSLCHRIGEFPLKAGISVPIRDSNGNRIGWARVDGDDE